jgi:glycosyltransferase involved in cell wall biosynthesis
MQKEDYILYAGRIYWHKGIEYLLEAFAEAEKNFDVRLKLAGIGDIEFYKDKVKKLGIKNVEFLDSVDNSKMPDLMGKAKIFVLPTVTREGHPKALIEAMACGCACIATDVPGNSELIQDGENGLLVRPKDKKSLLDAFVKILNDENLRLKLSENARKTAEKFSVENTLYKEIELIKKIMEGTKNV